MGWFVSTTKTPKSRLISSSRSGTTFLYVYTCQTDRPKLVWTYIRWSALKLFEICTVVINFSWSSSCELIRVCWQFKTLIAAAVKWYQKQRPPKSFSPAVSGFADELDRNLRSNSTDKLLRVFPVRLILIRFLVQPPASERALQIAWSVRWFGSIEATKESEKTDFFRLKAKHMINLFNRWGRRLDADVNKMKGFFCLLSRCAAR
jgi:hypothetical protein